MKWCKPGENRGKNDDEITYCWHLNWNNSSNNIVRTIWNDFTHFLNWYSLNLNCLGFSNAQSKIHFQHTYPRINAMIFENYNTKKECKHFWLMYVWMMSVHKYQNFHSLLFIFSKTTAKNYNISNFEHALYARYLQWWWIDLPRTCTREQIER